MTNRLLELRLEQKVKRAFLASVLETDVSTVYRWEVLQKPIPFDKLLKAARFFEVAATNIVPALGEVLTEEVTHV